MSIFVNGKICKDPKLANADDFFTSGFNISGEVVDKKYGYATKIVDINKMLGLNTLGIVDINKMLGLNTLGISIIRADFEPKGTIYAGFLLLPPNEENIYKSRLFAKILNPGDVFVIPQGLIDFAHNVESTNATLFASFNSRQSPEFILIPDII
ncbi:hypothetical protein RDI58_023217 [Solanum bulbocastanum]|uniref:Germin-like protein n=1 Tax=Solanum bulbocastanum TaxID=147425 RepID=A0AAN8Y923_SOLBU